MGDILCILLTRVNILCIRMLDLLHLDSRGFVLREGLRSAKTELDWWIRAPTWPKTAADMESGNSRGLPNSVNELSITFQYR
jgi:hypothetical protein